MRIADVKVLSLQADPGDWPVDSSFFDTLVVVTSDDGLKGFGETEGEASIVRAVVDAPTIHPFAHGLRSVVMGQPADDPEALHDRMYEASSYFGRRGAVSCAISAIDMALWDLLGKAEGKPVSELIGTPRRDRLPVYVSAYPLGDTRDSVCRALDAVLAYAPRAIKLCAEADWGSPAGAARMEQAIEVAREHCGPDIDLMVDMYGAWRCAEHARAALPTLAAHGVRWLEAPLPLDDLDGYASLQGFGVPIAAGDLGASTRFEFHDLMERGGVDIVQPDLSVAGGFTETRRISAEAHKLGRRMLMHHYKSDLLLAANLHVMATERKADLVEYSLSPSAIRNALVTEPLELQADGTILVPAGPGLGVTLRQETVRQCCVQ
jgi:L-rhamnonate dehydratase